MQTKNRFLHDLMSLVSNKNKFETDLAEVRLLATKYGTIEYCSFGIGSPLILVMGYAATLNGWDFRFLSQLAKFHQIIVFSNRNTGNSKFAKQNFTIEDLADDVEALRIGLNLGKISLAGISLGGVIAQQYAFLYPNNLVHLILINTLPPGELIQHLTSEIVDALRSVNKKSLLNYSKLLRLLFPSVWQIPALWIFHFKPEGSKNIVSSSTLLAQQEALEQWSVLSNLKIYLNNVTKPTLVLVGDTDDLIPPINSKILCNHIPKAKLTEIKGGDHIMIFQYPAEIAQLITEFIEK